MLKIELRPRLFAITEEGGHWYAKKDGGVFKMSKAEMKHSEDVHIRPEHGWSNYDFKWSYVWYQLGQAVEMRNWFNSLTDEQKELLEEQVR